MHYCSKEILIRFDYLTGNKNFYTTSESQIDDVRHNWAQRKQKCRNLKIHFLEIKFEPDLFGFRKLEALAGAEKGFLTKIWDPHGKIINILQNLNIS